MDTSGTCRRTGTLSSSESLPQSVTDRSCKWRQARHRRQDRPLQRGRHLFKFRKGRSITSNSELLRSAVRSKQ